MVDACPAPVAAVRRLSPPSAARRQLPSFFFFFFCNFRLTTGRVKKVGISLTVLGRLSDLRLRVEVSAKLLHRSCVELFLDEYIKISNLDSQRKIVDLRKTFKILRCGFSRSLDGKCDSERQHLLLPSKKSLPLNRGWQRLMAIGFPSTLSFSLFLFCHTIARVPFGPL